MKPSALLPTICFLGIPIACAFSGASATAQDYPARLVKIIVQTPAGSSVDVTARILANQLTNLWGQQVLVFNLPGGGGTVAARAAAIAAPDGYTMFMPAASIYVSMPELYPDKSTNLSRDLMPVGFVGEQPLAIAISPSLGVNSLEELIDLSQKQPARINWAAVGPVGSLPHLAGELFRTRSSASITGVPYPSTSEAVSDLLSGRVQMIVETLPSLTSLVAGGKLKVLAFASEKRLRCVR
jgi:tripartite-type tricarboxylate transporter receptor subunit TctC